MCAMGQQKEKQSIVYRGPADGVDAGWDTVWDKIQTRDYLKPSSRSIALWSAYYEQFDHICLKSDVALCDVHPKRPFS